MKRDANGPALSAIFIDYDNIYLSLKRKNEDAARRFSKDAGLWLRELESGALITATSGFATAGIRRIVMNRCYGNPVPRRNAHDNSTDMNSFPFIRHHFLRSGAEVIDCPPLTAQLKNSADIRIVMDVRDMITHDTYFDEFIILSSDADFTPLLHRLRAHARRTVIYANDQTASPYTAISDGEVREADLLRLLLDGRGSDRAIAGGDTPAQLPNPAADNALLRRDLANEAANLVRAAGQPVPLEALADRLVRTFGHERTAGNGWAGMGGFRDLLVSYLPDGLKISEQPPFVVFDVTLPEPPQQLDHSSLPPQPQALPQALPQAQPQALPHFGLEMAARPSAPAGQRPPSRAMPDQRTNEASPSPVAQRAMPPSAHGTGPGSYSGNGNGNVNPAGHPAGAATGHRPAAPQSAEGQGQAGHAPRASTPTNQGRLPPSEPQRAAPPSPAPQPSAQSPGRTANLTAAAVQQMVARIYDACQAPAIAPAEYRLVFEVMAQEISARGLNGMATLDSIASLTKGFGVKLERDDIRFILEVVSEGDEWFENGVSANLFATRFRNFVYARCRGTGLALSADEIDLIDHWFTGSGQPASTGTPTGHGQQPPPQRQLPAPPTPQQNKPAAPISTANPVDIWWSTDAASGQRQTGTDTGDDFPRIIRSRSRG